MLGGGVLSLEAGVFAPRGVTEPSGATVLPYLSLVSPGGVGLVPWEFGALTPVAGAGGLSLENGVLVPFGVTEPSGATVLPYLSLVSPGGVGLVVCCVFCVAEVP
jgi:hypothetical protein